MVLFIDTDPGSDDIMAIIYLIKHSNHQVVGMSSVAGNLDIETTTRNLRLIAGYFNNECQKNIEVYKGAANSIVDVLESDAKCYHGNDGCGNFYSSEYYNNHKDEIEQLIDSVKLSPLPAVMGLIELSKKYCGELSIVALGPLTNIALAQIIDPEFGSRIKAIMMMGGDIYGFGNCEVHVAAEFNFNKDAEAAYVVLKEMKCPKTILPLEPNSDVAIRKEISVRWEKQLQSKNDVLSNIMFSIINFHNFTYPTLELYDLMLAMVFDDQTVVDKMLTVNAVVELEGRYTRGKLVIDHFNKGEKHSFRPFRIVNIVKALNYDTVLQGMEKLFQ